MTQESDLAAKETCDGGGALFRARRTSVFFIWIRFDRFVYFRPQNAHAESLRFREYFCPPFVQSENWVFDQDGRTRSDCKALILKGKSPLTR